ncbi:hypothetical protein U0070_007907, partial [Myodes glareolus]
LAHHWENHSALLSGCNKKKAGFDEVTIPLPRLVGEECQQEASDVADQRKNETDDQKSDICIPSLGQDHTSDCHHQKEDAAHNGPDLQQSSKVGSRPSSDASVQVGSRPSEDASVQVGSRPSSDASVQVGSRPSADAGVQNKIPLAPGRMEPSATIAENETGPARLDKQTSQGDSHYDRSRPIRPADPEGI